MSEPPAFRPDPCEDFLQARITGCGGDQLRQSLLEETTRVLRHRRRRKQLVLIAALAACYAAGLATMRIFDSPALGDTPVATGDEAPMPAPRPPTQSEPALVQEQRSAAADQRERAELFRRAGDRYLEEEGDPEWALRCYTQYLNAGAEADLEITVEDNWLLMAIKDARQKEKRHAKNGS